jgi:hypothetical protein
VLGVAVLMLNGKPTRDFPFGSKVEIAMDLVSLGSSNTLDSSLMSTGPYTLSHCIRCNNWTEHEDDRSISRRKGE